LAPPPQLFSRPRRHPFDWGTAVIGTLVGAAAITVLVRQGRERFFEILTGDLFFLGAMVFKVLAGCLIGAFLALLIPRETVQRWVGGESGLIGLIVGTAVGVVMPGGGVTIFPMAAAFLVIGADIGAMIAFVTSWMLLGFNRALVWELPFFGGDFLIWRMIVALPLPVVAGLLARLVVRFLARRKEGEG
jgi:uncharacterized membrane protein YraQ (UPF0718 family)